MNQKNRSLCELHPKAFDIPLILISAIILLVYGLKLPIITFKEFGIWKHTFSVLTGIQSLWVQKEMALAVIIFVFSVIFPIVKLAVLLIIWFLRMSTEKLKSFINFVGLMGKWSMLDVFVVAITIVITKFSHALNARPELGIYIFASSIALSIVALMRIESFIKKS